MATLRNIFLSQIYLLFHRLHNRLLDERYPDFEEAQRGTHFHYQWLVLFDLLKQVCDPVVYKFAIDRLMNGCELYPLIYKPGTCDLPMPVEFSVAAYRVGHTMMRSRYAANAANPNVELFDERFGTLGFNSYPQNLVVDWRYLLPMERRIRPRMSKAIDPLLADELQDMPRQVVSNNNPNDRALAFQNLLWGNAMGLPSGQDIAKALQAAGYPEITPIPASQLGAKLPDRLAARPPILLPTMGEQTQTPRETLRAGGIGHPDGWSSAVC